MLVKYWREVGFALEESEYNELVELCKEKQLTPYSLAKRLVKEWLELQRNEGSVKSSRFPSESKNLEVERDKL